MDLGRDKDLPWPICRIEQGALTVAERKLEALMVSGAYVARGATLIFVTLVVTLIEDARATPGIATPAVTRGVSATLRFADARTAPRGELHVG